MSFKKVVISYAFLLFLFPQIYADIVRVDQYRNGYVAVLNEQNKVFLEFMNEEKEIHRRIFVFHGKANYAFSYNDKVFIVGISDGKGILYVSDVSGVVSFKYFNGVEETLQVVPCKEGLFIVGKRKADYLIMLTDFYGHVAWKKTIVERSDFVKLQFGEYLYVIFSSSIYKMDLKGNVLLKKIYKSISSAFLFEGRLYIVFNHDEYSFTQDGVVFVEDGVKDVCVIGKDVYTVGEKGIWKGKKFLMRGSFEGINCTEDCIIVWTRKGFSRICRGNAR